MKDKHVFFRDGVEWRRVFLAPNPSIDTKIDPFSKRDFIDKTSKKFGTLGDLTDISKELSLKRESSAGKDNVRENFYKNYTKTRGGKRKHPEQSKEELRRDGIELD